MNSPVPVPGGGPNVAPSAGAMLGSVAGLLVAHKLGLDPMTAAGGMTVGSVATTITALFHWLGIKTGIPGLG